MAGMVIRRTCSRGSAQPQTVTRLFLEPSCSPSRNPRQCAYGMACCPRRMTSRTAMWRRRSLSAGVRPQAGDNLVRLMQLGEEACDQALGLGPQGLGFASGLIPQRRRLGVPYPDRAVAGTGRQATCRPG